MEQSKVEAVTDRSEQESLTGLQIEISGPDALELGAALDLGRLTSQQVIRKPLIKLDSQILEDAMKLLRRQ